MLKKTITYTDYNGTVRTEDKYFNLSKAELMQMEMGTPGGFANMLQNIINAQDGASIIKIMNDLISKSYGVKSPDGKQFIKSEELSREFMQTEAYSEMFMEMVTDANAAADFVNGIIPADLAAEAAKNAAIPQIAPVE